MSLIWPTSSPKTQYFGLISGLRKWRTPITLISSPSTGLRSLTCAESANSAGNMACFKNNHTTNYDFTTTTLHRIKESTIISLLCSSCFVYGFRFQTTLFPIRYSSSFQSNLPQFCWRSTRRSGKCWEIFNFFKALLLSSTDSFNILAIFWSTSEFTSARFQSGILRESPTHHTAMLICIMVS